MKGRIKLLILCILIPLAVGGLSALLTGQQMQAFGALQKPPLSPPGWLFPVVWTILFILMGIASYLVLTAEADPTDRKTALWFYGAQLAFNFLWSIFFFRFDLYLFSFFWLLALWLLILVTMLEFYRIRKAAGWLMVPYLIWVTFAAYLNLGIVLLN